MDELRHRLERLTREGTATAGAPEVSHIRGRAHRLRRRVTGAVLAVALLSALVLGPGRAFTSWIENANPTGPLRPVTPTTTNNRDPVANNPIVKQQGRPIAPVIVVAQGTFEGRAWKYLAYRTDRGKVCGQLRRLAAGPGRPRAYRARRSPADDPVPRGQKGAWPGLHRDPATRPAQRPRDDRLRRPRPRRLLRQGQQEPHTRS
jgi:hypothetical protein